MARKPGDVLPCRTALQGMSNGSRYLLVVSPSRCNVCTKLPVILPDHQRWRLRPPLQTRRGHNRHQDYRRHVRCDQPRVIITAARQTRRSIPNPSWTKLLLKVATRFEVTKMRQNAHEEEVPHQVGIIAANSLGGRPVSVPR